MATSLDEAVVGDFSGDRLAPTFWLLDAIAAAPTPGLFNNVLSGTAGRAPGASAADVDYVNFRVPVGYQLSALRVGNQTQSAGSVGSFIGLAAGPTMPLPPNAPDASGLLGWRHYSAADRNTDILPAMAVPLAGSSGFSVPLPAGDYTLWIQELAPGSYTYRFNLQVSVVPEPGTAWTLLAGLLALGVWRRRPAL